MTRGHRHRKVRVTEGSLLYRALRKPLVHTRCLSKVDRSRYPYGPCRIHPAQVFPCYTLSALGILHRWTGLTLEVREP